MAPSPRGVAPRPGEDGCGSGPRARPSTQGEEPVEETGGETPHGHARDLERGTHEATGVAHAQSGWPGPRARRSGPGEPRTPRPGRRPRRGTAHATSRGPASPRTTTPAGAARGRTAKTSIPAGSSPVSSFASRRAAATAPSSPASSAPPGKAGWPAWARRSAARREEDVACRSRRRGRLGRTEQHEHRCGPGRSLGHRGHAEADQLGDVRASWRRRTAARAMPGGPTDGVTRRP